MRQICALSLISILFYVSKQRFWAGSGIGRNQEMVSQLQSEGVIRSKKVAQVMETIDRALFVPAGAQPYVDSPMPIGHNATISAPHMHAMCLELLENQLKPGMCALDVGSGNIILFQSRNVTRFLLLHFRSFCHLPHFLMIYPQNHFVLLKFL